MAITKIGVKKTEVRIFINTKSKAYQFYDVIKTGREGERERERVERHRETE